MTDTSSACVRLFNLLRAVREAVPFVDMSAEEEQLLSELIVRWHDGGAVKVSDVMHGAARNSPSSTYRRLLKLKENGLVTMRADTADKRVRFVEPTAKAREYKQRIERQLDAFIRDEKFAS